MKTPGPFIRFGSYLLVERIASGGMAEVYRARVTGLRGFSKTVAIKKIHPHLMRQRNFLNMFIDEAKIASKLTHPNIVQIFELGQLSGQPFIAMEYVPGQDLYGLLEKLRKIMAPCSWPLAVRVILEVAKALHHAHEFKGPDGRMLGIVHRDVSPRNILLSFSGDVKLTDFGIARALEREETTQTGVIKGKIRYLSPEAAKGQPVDRRSDVFSLGVVLAEMLTMEAFRQGPSNLAILAEIRKGAERQHHFDAIPEELIRVLSRALEPNPLSRYPSAIAFHDELAKVAVGPIAPMSRKELGTYLSAVFSSEKEALRQRENMVEKFLLHWKDQAPPERESIARVSDAATVARREAPVISGRIDETSLTRIFGNLLVDGRTGALELLRHPVEKSLYLLKGQIVHVGSNVRAELFGEFLIERKLLSRETVQRALEQAENEGNTLTGILLREKILTPGALFNNLSEQLHRRVFDAFCWANGEFAFYPGSLPEGVDQKLCLDTLNIIQIAVFEYLPLALIRKNLGGLARARAHLSHTSRLEQISLTGRMQGMLATLQKGECPVGELQAGEGDESFMRSVYLLKELGLIELETPGS